MIIRIIFLIHVKEYNAFEKLNVSLLQILFLLWPRSFWPTIVSKIFRWYLEWLFCGDFNCNGLQDWFNDGTLKPTPLLMHLYWEKLEVQDINFLTTLPNLMYLSLLGNEIAMKPRYRWGHHRYNNACNLACFLASRNRSALRCRLYVIHRLKHLKHLDFKRVRPKVRPTLRYLPLKKCVLVADWFQQQVLPLPNN